jgi:small-conductance mechanosensitive channel
MTGTLLQASEMPPVPTRVWLALVVVAMGVLVGFVLARLSRRLLVRVGVPSYIEGTSFERSVRNFGTSTVSVLTRLLFLFVVGVSLLVALSIVEITYADRFWNNVAGYLPQLFVALLVVIVGTVVGDKVQLVVAERLRGVKLPEANVIPALAKYTVFFLTALVALSQLGVATLPLVVLLAAYLLAVVVFGAIASRDLLASGTAGTYLLLNQPYGIGDEVRVGDTRGIVQEVGLFVTHIETDDEEHIVPNRLVLTEGVVRIRS